jgi:hypothetical protein
MEQTGIRRKRSLYNADLSCPRFARGCVVYILHDKYRSLTATKLIYIAVRHR